MYKLYYLPEGKDIDDIIMSRAAEHKCSQIIVGRSDIITRFITDYDTEQVIHIPEVHQLFLNGETFKVGQEIEAIYVNEWKMVEPFDTVKFVLRKVDMDKPKETVVIKEMTPEYDNEFRYTQRFSIDEYGEYKLECIIDEDELISRVDLIVYGSEEAEQDEGPRFTI